ncbi:ParB/RepB/Spo0J family partition protein [Tolumonas auensis]|uniref:ParB/RepB/Spo0J family partition protein n=1 Tax=Tolumonas auensis TaxID=43948 RepID=UPI002AA601BA|nr:ParB/RepB/Spo0J family partition protein [Tolumonas auensis]
MTSKKRGLGKGLEALLGTSQVARQKQILSDIQADAAQDKVDNQKGELQILPVSWLRPGKYQPRRDMSQDALEDLANSIRAQGVIQPIVVRQLAEQQYEIIAGERRWRACQLVRLETVPCLIKNVEDNAAVAIALIENIQREDLNAIEEAVALQRLMTEFELSHQQVAEAVGKSRSAVSNLLRLNHLNEDVKQLVEHGDLDMGHARALLSLEGEQQSEVARTVAQKSLTVRDTERMVQKLLNPAAAKPEPEVDQQSVVWSECLSGQLGLSVQFVRSGDNNGKIILSYQNAAEFEKIRHLFNLS